MLWLLDSDACCACRTLVDHQALAISGESLNGSNLLYHFLVPEFYVFQQIMACLDAHDIPVRILKMSPRSVQNTLLTPKQERALMLAKDLGFFHYPRDITLHHLAQQVGIAASTLSERLRRGTLRLVDHYVSSL
jgi:predicted DNA binding protein